MRFIQKIYAQLVLINSPAKLSLLIFGLTFGALGLTSCSLRMKEWQGECTSRNVVKERGDWELIKEVCFDNPNKDGITQMLEKMGLFAEEFKAESTQLWINRSTLKRKENIIQINFIQKAIFKQNKQKNIDQLEKERDELIIARAYLDNSFKSIEKSKRLSKEINLIQKAIFKQNNDAKKRKFLPPYLIKTANIDCESSMYKDKYDEYKLINEWKKGRYQIPAQSYQFKGNEVVYNSPLNPYGIIKAEFCNIKVD